MIERSRSRIVVRATVEVPATALFAVLADPGRHLQMDGSGTLRAGADNAAIAGVGQVFTMEMHHPSLGDYRTDNHVVDFLDGHRIAWMTAREGQPPAGVRWSWELEPEGPGRTTVVHTHDWSGVTDPAVLARVTFPRVSGEALEQSIQRLARVATST